MIIKLTQAHVIGAIIAFLLGIFIVPIVIYFSEKANLVDIPNARKIHTGKISRLGGVAIWLSLMLTFVLLVLLSLDYPKGVGLSGIIVGGSLMFLLGLIDDIYCLDAKFKLFIQIAIASILILLGVRFENLYYFGNSIDLGFWSYPISLLWIVGISNAMNFIDGIDGLAGSITSIACGAIAIISLVLTPPSTITALIALILLGSMLSFLTYNYNPAKVFMGDSGALFSGFMLATLSITGISKNGGPYMYLPLLILALPMLDVAFSSIRRMLKGTSPFIADSEHIHHQLLHIGYSQDMTVIILASISLIFSIVAIALAGSLNKYFLYIPIFVAVLILLSIVSKSIKKKN